MTDKIKFYVLVSVAVVAVGVSVYFFFSYPFISGLIGGYALGNIQKIQEMFNKYKKSIW